MSQQEIIKKIGNSRKFSAAEKFILKKLITEIPEHLYYHGVHHTLDVLDAALTIAKEEHLSATQLRLLRIAVLYHDAGFIKVYENHESYGCELAKEFLPGFDFTTREIDVVCKLILATAIPQKPSTKLEKIICDADLDYLGRKDFNKISTSLFNELKIYSMIKDEDEWNERQLQFLSSHKYHTRFSKIRRDPVKQAHLEKLKDKGTGSTKKHADE